MEAQARLFAGGGDLQNLKILVIDDSALVLHAVKLVLERQGSRVLIQGSPFGAAAKVIAERPDVVIIDLQMPGLDGESLARVIRATPQTKNTRLLLFSDLPEADIAGAANRAHADGFFRKTIDPAILVSSIKSAISKRNF